MKLTITIQMDNEAFEGNPYPEVKSILDDLGRRFDSGWLFDGEAIPLRDSNGNTVGQAKVTK